MGAISMYGESRPGQTQPYRAEIEAPSWKWARRPAAYLLHYGTRWVLAPAEGVVMSATGWPMSGWSGPAEGSRASDGNPDCGLEHSATRAGLVDAVCRRVSRPRSSLGLSGELRKHGTALTSPQHSQVVWTRCALQPPRRRKAARA